MMDISLVTESTFGIRDKVIDLLNSILTNCYRIKEAVFKARYSMEEFNVMLYKIHCNRIVCYNAVTIVTTIVLRPTKVRKQLTIVVELLLTQVWRSHESY